MSKIFYPAIFHADDFVALIPYDEEKAIFDFIQLDYMRYDI